MALIQVFGKPNPMRYNTSRVLKSRRRQMVATPTLEGLIVKDPQLRGGRPVIAGTGVTVRTVVGYYKLGLTPEETADQMDLDLALVYAALAYYHLNRDELEADILAHSEEALAKDFGRA
jgi:uncharacterized protein (DUF433 family)